MIQKAKQTALRLLAALPHNNIFEFHHVSDRPAIELSTRKMGTELFYSFVDRHGPYLPLKELMGRKKLDGHGAITFDDGLEDVYTVAYAYLKPRNIPFTAFILTDMLDTPGYLTREQLLELAADPLVTLGSHGTDHTHLAEATEQKQRVELIDSKRKMEEMLNRPCEYFAYPFGEYSELTLRIAREAGYDRVFAVRGRPLFPWNQKDPYAIPRLSIANETWRKYDCF